MTETSPGAGWVTTYTVGAINSTANAVVTVSNPITATRFTPSGPITGTVYRDYNSDGNISANGTVTDTGVQSVTVSIYDINGELRETTVSDASGRYTFTVASLDTVQGPYRVEFSNLPAGYEPSRSGLQNGTSVQFINADSVAARTLNLGVLEPCDYCQSNPDFAVAFARSTTSFMSGFSSPEGIRRYSISSLGTTRNEFPPATASIMPSSEIVAGAAVGNINGMAWRRSSRTLFASAYGRANDITMGASDGIGPSGLGGIYKVSNGVASPFVTVANVGSFTGAMSEVGTVGIGGIALSSDESTLYAINMNAETLVVVPIIDSSVSAGAQTQITLPQPANCSANETHPFGIGTHKNKVYVGMVCGGPVLTDLRAYVYSYDGAVFVSELDFSMNYVRTDHPDDNNTNDVLENIDHRAIVWENNPPLAEYVNHATDNNLNARRERFAPMLVDILFHGDDMVLGFRSRLSDQIVNAEWVIGGELLRACASTSGATTTWQIENNGICNGKTTINPPPIADSWVGRNTAQATSKGPGGYEYYWGDNGFEGEMTQGALTMIPGGDALYVTQIDALGHRSQHGIAAISHSTGQTVAAGNTAHARFSLAGVSRAMKSNQMGDIEALCDATPIEIGNRVWNDVNANGVQDPGELALAGVIVSLQTPSGTITTTTNVSGTYVFTREAISGAYTQTLRPNTAYVITINPAQTALSGFGLTTPNAQAISDSPTSNHAISDTRDSDAYLVNGTPSIYYTTGTAGQNNHGLDFGFVRPATVPMAITNVAPPTLEVVKTIVGGSSAAAFPITVTGPDGFISNTTVSAGTPAVFENIAPGVYTVTEGSLPAAPTGYTWIASPIYAPSGGAVSVAPGTLAQVKITNLLGQSVAPTATLILTKSVVGSSQSNYEITLTGPSYPAGETFGIISGTNTITNLIPGVYTVTETSPGAGWVTTYTVGAVSTTTSAVVTTTNQITAAATAAGQITGVVYNDYNNNGVRDTTGVAPNFAVDAGVAGVLVTAYDRNGAIAGTATTTATGAYTLSTTASGLTGPYRLEFTNLPADYRPSGNGTGNGTSTQFVSAPATSVNFGILKPSNYCQNNPWVCSPIAVNGDGSNGTISIAAMSYDSLSNKTVAIQSQTGATWGLAYKKNTSQLFASALVKRHTGLGSLGLGGIYVVNATSATPAATSFIDLEAAPYNINFGNLPGNGPTGRNLPAVVTTPNLDPLAFAAAGTQGIGDIDLSDDGNTLWVVNLYTATANLGSLIKIDVANGTAPTSVTQYPLGAMSGVPTCIDGVLRPWALKIHNGVGYLGAVCSGEYKVESGIATATNTDLHAYVLSFDLNNPTTLTSVLDFPLDYAKGRAGANATTTPTGADTLWHSWRPIYAKTDYATIGNTYQLIRAVPILSDIEFDETGAMILGFIDRGSLQFGDQNYSPTDATASYRYFSSGELLRACSNASGVLELESNGVCGDRTTTWTGGTGETGPGGGEFYMDNTEFANCAPYCGPTIYDVHQELANGGVAVLQGSQEVVWSTIDPDYFNSGGLAWDSNVNGTRLRDGQLYAGINTNPAIGGNGFMGKAGGMGDVELLCDLAPIEIGNRVWNDVNGNGVQDPGEPALSGVAVQLIHPTTGAVLQTVTTNISGTYYFTREATTGAYSQTLRPNTPYVITIAPTQTALSGYSLTQANAQAISGSATSNDAISDTRDSDAYLVNGTPSIYYTTGTAGQNNHGLDFGFSKPPPMAGLMITNTAPAYIPALFGDRVWIESDNDGLVSTGSITPVAGMVISATDGAVTYTVTTNAQGYYSFSVPAGTYTVTYGAMPLAYGLVLPSATPGSGTLSGNSGSYAEGGNPDQSHPQGTVVTVDETEANWQVDFAFTPRKFDLGNRVWFDTDNDGLLNNGELPVGGVTVQLRDSTGAVISTTTTNASGYYAFANLYAGTYTVTVAASNFARWRCIGRLLEQ